MVEPSFIVAVRVDWLVRTDLLCIWVGFSMERLLHCGDGQEQRPRPADKSAESLALIECYGMIVLGIHQDGEGCGVGPHRAVTCVR